jgi:CHASE3 domain sensor protein
VTTRKAALQLAALGLLALMAFYAYLAIDQFKRIQASAALSLESSTVQADIARVRQDFTDMETGQRGYLLTDDASYLQPYSDAKNAMATDLANLSSALATRPQSEESIEAQLESLAAAMQGEIERTVALRQQGYRHRSFQLVQKDQGKQEMDQARSLVASLSSMESSQFATLEKERNASASKALTEIVAANVCLIALTAGLFLFVRLHERKLERESRRSQEGLALRDSQVEKLTKLMSALEEQTRVQIRTIEENVRMLLEKYDGFLPPAGYACAEKIKDATAQLEEVRKDMLGRPEFEMREKAA